MGVYAPLAWLALIGCCLAALTSFLGRRKRHRLLESQTGLDSLRNMDWRAFEQLVGEAFRRQGYAVEEIGQGGADGGIDLVLRKHGLTTLVQCKQWRSQRVSVQVVREMFGVLVDRGADAVKIVALGSFTPDAAAFARGKRIELVDDRTFLGTVMGIQAKKEPEGALDNPLLFVGGVLACLLIAFALPTQSGRPSKARTMSMSPAAPPHQSATAPQSVPLVRTPPAPAQAAVPPGRKVYEAEPPMSNEELRDWEKRNREAMKILEKTTPALETPPAR